ncbi:MAG: v-type synthase subunit [Chlamydiota bacterium]|jgi:V/A-type H+-transporting ATPase subunit D
MSLRLTKNELRNQQVRLHQFERYLPTLRLKKALLQFEVIAAQMEIDRLQDETHIRWTEVETIAPMIADKSCIDLVQYADVLHVKKHYENIAGVEIPIFESIVFPEPDYFLFDTPPATDAALEALRDWVIAKEKISIAEEKKRALEKELRDVSTRVNLFEKVLIPRALANITKIKIFLGDQQLAAVAQAKVAKKKIQEKSA